MTNRYRVKVTEKHSDYVWVDAESEEEAMRIAPEYAHCEFECITAAISHDTEQDLLDEVGAQIKELRLQLASKDDVINLLMDDIKYYRKDRKDQMKQDQGLPETGE